MNSAQKFKYLSFSLCIFVCVFVSLLKLVRLFVIIGNKCEAAVRKNPIILPQLFVHSIVCLLFSFFFAFVSLPRWLRIAIWKFVVICSSWRERKKNTHTLNSGFEIQRKSLHSFSRKYVGGFFDRTLFNQRLVHRAYSFPLFLVLLIPF